MIIVEASGITDVGRKRKGNEDSLFIDDDLQLYVVADGMGGHNAGEVASKLVVDTIRDMMRQPEQDPTLTALNEDQAKTLSDKAKSLYSSILAANRIVFESGQEDAARQGMGSTVSAISFIDNRLIHANVGDSPIYLVRNGAMDRLYVPHTMMEEFKAIAPEGSKLPGEQYNHVLTRAMGPKEFVEPHIAEIDPSEGDILIISSDGLTDMVPDKEILDVLIRSKPAEACKTLVEMANKQGGVDNITIIVIHVKKIAEQGIQLPEIETPREPSPEPDQEKLQIAVEYDTEDHSHRSFIHHISVDGVFIETRDPFTIGEELMLTFSVVTDHSSFMITGKVAKRDSKGIYVKFEGLTQQNTDLVESLSNRLK
jgi:PPM family protein phosphatase